MHNLYNKTFILYTDRFSVTKQRFAYFFIRDKAYLIVYLMIDSAILKIFFISFFVTFAKIIFTISFLKNELGLVLRE